MGNTKLQKISINGGISLFVIVVFTFVFLIVFGNRSKTTYTEIANQKNNDYIRSEALEVSNTLSCTLSAADSVAEIMSGLEAESDIVEMLSGIAESTDAETVLLVDADYLAIDQSGNAVDLNLVEYKDHFTASASSIFGIVDAQDADIAKYVCKTKTRDDKFVLAYIPATAIESVLDKEELAQYSFAAIINRGYDLLATYGDDVDSAYFSNGSFWKNVKSSITYRTSVAVFTQKIKDSSSHVIELRFGADDRYFCSQMIPNTDCYIVLGVEAAYMSKQVNTYMNPQKLLHAEVIIVAIAMIILYVVVVVLINFHSKVNSKELEGKADTDLLTGLSNKLATEARIQEYVETSPGSQGVLILIDVDNFKKINDTMGHAFGDEVLRNLGIRLKSLYRVTDIIGRIGGDEFVVFLKDIPDIAIIEREARKLETFFKGFEVGEYVKYSVTASLGAAIFSMDGNSFEELYKNADAALYDAKHKGKKQLFFYKQDEKEELLKGIQKPSEAEE